MHSAQYAVMVRLSRHRHTFTLLPQAYC